MQEEVFIVLFRGVGGDTKLPTAPLRDILMEAGFAHVSTFIATGNVVLAAGLPAGEVMRRVAALAEERLGFRKPVFAVPAREWGGMVARNPFPEAVAEPRTLHVFLLECEPDPEAVRDLAGRVSPGERIVADGRFVYFHAPGGFGPSRLPPVIDRVLKMATTARNWNTVVKLDEIATRTRAALRG